MTYQTYRGGTVVTDGNEKAAPTSGTVIVTEYFDWPADELLILDARGAGLADYYILIPKPTAVAAIRGPGGWLGLMNRACLELEAHITQS